MKEHGRVQVGTKCTVLVVIMKQVLVIGICASISMPIIILSGQDIFNGVNS